MVKLEALYIKLSRQLHYIYLLYAIPMVYLVATITPPFQNPDEPNHFMRAEQVSRLEMVPVFVHNKNAHIDSISPDKRILYPHQGGFKVDQGIRATHHIFSAIHTNPNVKAVSANFDSAKHIKWGSGMAYVNFGNTGIYPPVVYTMPALGIAAGKLLHLSVIRTLYLSRLLNGALSVAICFFALLLAKRSNLLMFIVLLFPMSISLFGSVSQDAVLISCAFLFVAIVDHAEFNKEAVYRNWQIYVMIILMCIIGISKPPYVLFGVVFLFLKFSPKLKIIAIGIPVLVVASWILINHANFSIIYAPPEIRANSKLQVLHIVHHPFKFMGMFFKFDPEAFSNFLHMFIGILGWLDLEFTRTYYRIAYGIIFIGFIISYSFKRHDHDKLRVVLLASSFITLVAILTAQYVTWTALESPTLGGMQGRYFLPVFPFLALAVSSSVKNEIPTRLKSILFMLILIFPMCTAINLVDSLVARFYLN